MPKPTFHNLPAAKRQRILAAAADEFSVHSLQSASVNRVVKAAGIAKGSFYQYFSGLDDLYRHLVFEHGTLLKMEALKAAGPPPEGGDFFDTMTYYAVQGLRFGLAYPRISAAARHLVHGAGTPAMSELAAELTHRRRLGTRHMLEQAIASGAVRADVDLDTAAIFTEQCLSTTLDAMFRHRFGVDVLELCSKPELADGITDAGIAEAVDLTMDFLRRAIGTGTTEGAELDLDGLLASVENHQ